MKSILKSFDIIAKQMLRAPSKMLAIKIAAKFYTKIYELIEVQPLLPLVAFECEDNVYSPQPNVFWPQMFTGIR